MSIWKFLTFKLFSILLQQAVYPRSSLADLLRPAAATLQLQGKQAFGGEGSVLAIVKNE